MKKILLLSLFLSCFPVASQETIQQTKPGRISTTDTVQRKWVKLNDGSRAEVGITEPSLQLFEPKRPNGSSILLIPGGSLYMLQSESEGVEIAQWLQERGVLVYLYRYRLKKSVGENYSIDTMKSFSLPSDYERVLQDEIYKEAVVNAISSLNYVWEDLAARGMAKSNVGLMGFSVGAAMCFDIAALLNEGRPGFLISINGFADSPKIKDFTTLPSAFIGCNASTSLQEPVQSAKIFNDFFSKDNSAELHVYSSGSLSVNNVNTIWKNDLERWLRHRIGLN